MENIGFLDIGHQAVKDANPGEIRNKQLETCDCPRHSPEVSRHGAGRGPDSPAFSPRREEGTKIPRAKAAGGTGPSTGESSKELSSDAKGPLRCSKKFRSVHVCEETIRGHLMNHPRELKRSLPFTFKPGIVAIPTKQSENLCDTQSTGQRTRQNFTSVVGEISPRLSENPPNTTLNQDLNRWN